MPDIVNGAQINETHAHVSRSRSTFNLKQRIFDTYRFGEYHPHFVFDGVSSDKLVLRSIHNARSYTLKAPLMQDIQMHKDYFYVPLRAILPMQAERVITNPTLGDDVPADAYTNVTDFVGKIKVVSDSLSTVAGNSQAALDYDTELTLVFKQAVLLESVFSNGSLLNSLGCALTRCLRFENSSSSSRWITGRYFTIDEYFDSLVSNLVSTYNTYFRATIDGVQYFVYTSDSFDSWQTGGITINVRRFLELIRDTSDWTFTNIASEPLFIKDVVDGDIVFNFSQVTGLDIDIARLWAYHLCQAEFYTNDKVDYIYSAELFRQYIYSLLVESYISFGSSIPPSVTHFSWNGQLLAYDYLSSRFFVEFITTVVYSLTNSLSYVDSFQYFLTLFGYHRSLRFKDYFVGSRTRPLAVGDTNAPVVSNQVNVVDVTRKIQLQRYLNAVNATGRKFEEYLKGIFGEAPSPDHHNPLLLAHTSDSIFAAENENTGSDVYSDASGLDFKTSQNSVTAVFRGNGNQYAFEFDVKEPCIILGITSFDIERAYFTGIERSFFTKDRFDMFIPELQYVGDQAVYRAEVDVNNASPMSAFGYQFRDMQRKQLVNRSSGGFSADVLPGYAFVYRPTYVSNNISPDFIRSRSGELDEFYLSLTGWSLGTYFHFIISTDNIVKAVRPMAVNPQILG